VEPFGPGKYLLLSTSLISLFIAAPAAAADPSHPPADQKPGGANSTGIAEGSTIVVTGTRSNVIAPVTESLQTTQPQSIVSRSFIEDSLPASADFNQIALISPSVSSFGGTNGVGLSESKAQIRGFQDGEYNITYDGVPFGDTNDPTHHSNTFFPSNTIETLIVDRGPGNAEQLGQATFGGNINLFSRVTRDDPSADFKASYGTWNTKLARALLQSGRVSSLGGAEFLVTGQLIDSDGARTHSPFNSKNIFGKAVMPVGSSVRFSILGTYNENRFHQPDKDGATLGQVALYGRNFSLNNDPNSQTYTGYNHTHKTTDFEIATLDYDVAPNISLQDKGYTYSYDNETLSGNNVTLYDTVTAANPTLAAARAAALAADTVVLTPGGAKTFGVPGYTKTNKYRVWGDIAKVRADFGLAELVAGVWYDRSHTYRQQRDVNLMTLAPNYIEKKVVDPVTGALTPANIKFDQHSNINHWEEFAQVEIRPFAGLKITPGIKHVSMERKIDAAYNQTTRFEQHLDRTYKATLPFLTANYAVDDRWSVYAQFARGFLTPPLSVLYVANPSLSTVEPERSTNYQAGFVYQLQHLSLDGDVYYIDFKNKFVPTGSGATAGFTNIGGAVYKGVEGQVTYSFGHGLAIFSNGSVNYAKTNNAGQSHTQIPNAPVATAAFGALYKRGPLKLSAIDKYIGHQWAFDGQDPNYRISGYNDTQLSARYNFGRVELGVAVDDLFNSRKVTTINQNSAVVVGGVTTHPYDQYFFQPGRSITGDLTVHL
jgi:iron complex outermembrane receptor protein